MDVLFYAPSLGEVTGGGRVVVDWASVAAQLGWRVTIATIDGQEPVWTHVENVSVVRNEHAPERPGLVLATIWWTAWQCDRSRRRGARAAQLHQGHEALWATNPDHFRIVQATYRLIQTKICVSRWVAASCASSGDTVHLVPPALAVPTAPRRQPRPGPVVVGLPFRALTGKGWEVMDAVAGRLRAAGAPLRFRVWGPGAATALAGRYEDVHEPASDQELLRLYDSCDILLYTSWHDGFPLPPIEAMARRVAVVVTGTGGLAEYGVHGRNCLVAAPGDVESLAGAVQRLAQDRDLRDHLGRHGVETAEHYSRERFVASAARTYALLAA
jgi:Glycosyl transferases group 1